MSADEDLARKRREAFELRKQKIEDLAKSGNEAEAKSQSDELQADKGDFYFEGIVKRDAMCGGSAEIPNVVRQSKSVMATLSDGDVTPTDVLGFNNFVGNLSRRSSELDGKISVLKKLNSKKSQAMLADLMLKRQYLRNIRNIVVTQGKQYISNDKAEEIQAKNMQPTVVAKPQSTDKDMEEQNPMTMLDRLAKDYLTCKSRTRGFYTMPSVAGQSLDNMKLSNNAKDNAKERLKQLMKQTRNPDRHKTFTADRAKDLLLRDKLLQAQHGSRC
ncbi:MAG: hypothetical protein AB7U85_01920 [Alphaproteobacteria bacterium]